MERASKLPWNLAISRFEIILCQWARSASASKLNEAGGSHLAETHAAGKPAFEPVQERKQTGGATRCLSWR
ncbi:hypothetical protein MPLA_1430033 [Mesorhizobium sp. ORS 3359]|nr:hypothetical protein MPLA_1430033 [Mesorhizobium sp. ORS 3359]